MVVVLIVGVLLGWLLFSLHDRHKEDEKLADELRKIAKREDERNAE